MKKFTLLSAVLVAGMATAQVAQVAPEQLKLQKMEPKSIEMNKEVSLDAWTGYSKKVANASYDLIDYYVVKGRLTPRSLRCRLIFKTSSADFQSWSAAL